MFGILSYPGHILVRGCVACLFLGRVQVEGIARPGRGDGKEACAISGPQQPVTPWSRSPSARWGRQDVWYPVVPRPHSRPRACGLCCFWAGFRWKELQDPVGATGRKPAQSPDRSNPYAPWSWRLGPLIAPGPVGATVHKPGQSPDPSETSHPGCPHPFHSPRVPSTPSMSSQELFQGSSHLPSTARWRLPSGARRRSATTVAFRPTVAPITEDRRGLTPGTSQRRSPRGGDVLEVPRTHHVTWSWPNMVST